MWRKRKRPFLITKNANLVNERAIKKWLRTWPHYTRTCPLAMRACLDTLAARKQWSTAGADVGLRGKLPLPTMSFSLQTNQIWASHGELHNRVASKQNEKRGLILPEILFQRANPVTWHNRRCAARRRSPQKQFPQTPQAHNQNPASPWHGKRKSQRMSKPPCTG